jgi:spermidine synthase
MQSAGQALSEPGAPRRLGLTALLLGLSTLAAETLWIRALGRSLGAAGEAFAATTVVLLAGLALGAAWSGRRAERLADPLALATRILLGAALFVAVTPWWFGLLPHAHLVLLGVLGIEPGAGVGLAVLLALPPLLPPALLLGAALPLLLAARRASPDREGRAVGGLCALHALGAALGVPLAVLGLWLVGERPALTAVALVLAVASLALRGAPFSAEPPSRPGATPTPRALLAALALVGAVALGAQAAALRLLEPLVGAHVFGTALVLLAALGGATLGSWAGGRAADRAVDPRRTLSAALVLAGLALATAPALAGTLPRLLLALGSPDPAARIALLALGAALVVLPASAALAACFPLAVRAAVAAGTTRARAAGELLGWNAAGCAFGGLAAGFLLLPSWGAATTICALAGLALAAGPLLRMGRGPVSGLVASALPLFVLAVPPVQSLLVSAGPRLAEVAAANARHAPSVPRAGGEPLALALASPEDVALYAEWFGGRPPASADAARREGRFGAVGLLEEPGGAIRLRVGGRAEARFDPDDADRPSITETALGLLPALAHPAPRRALVIGHGAGWTAEALLDAGLADVHVAETDAALLASVEAWRGHALAVRTDERAHLHLADGRLLLTAAAHGRAPRYDVIASQPSHPWSAASGHLYTREALGLARAALTERGVLAQWVNLFDMSPALLKRALATFRDVFPRAWLFLFDGELVLLGFAGEARLEPGRVVEMDDVALAAGPERGLAPGELWSRFALDGAGLARYAPAEHAPVGDERPVLELALAWRVLVRADDDTPDGGSAATLAREIRREPLPDFAAAVPDRETAARLTADAVDALARRRDLATAAEWEKHAPWADDGRARRVRATLTRLRGDHDTAEVLLRGWMTGHPEDAETAAEWITTMATGLAQRPDLVRAALADAAPLATRHADDGRVRVALARLAQMAGDLHTAREHYQAALRATGHPAPDGTAVAFARLLLALGSEGIAIGPGFPDLGAEGYALEMLRSDPEALADRSALALFARLERRLGDPERATTLEAALQGLEREAARAERRAAWSWLPQAAPEGLAAAERSVWLDPASVEGKELLALSRLAAGVRSGDEAVRRAAEGAARDALAEAWRLADDKPRQARRGAAYLAWFGAPEPEAPR